MSDNFHPLVELMLARMKSHPEEFEGGDGEVYDYIDPPAGERWRPILLQMKGHTTPEEEAALHGALRVIRMDALHHQAMDELLNGEERRRKAKEEEEKYRQQAQQLGAIGTISHSMAAQQNAYLNQLSNELHKHPAYSELFTKLGSAMTRGRHEAEGTADPLR